MASTAIDFSAGLPTAGAIKKAGHSGVFLYCSPPREAWMRGKQPSKGYVATLHANGIGTSFVYQYRSGGSLAAGDAGRGFAGGVSDALEARNYLKKIGLDGYPVFFAVDWDITLGEWNSRVVEYFKGAASVLGKQRVGIYGHSKVIHWAMQDKVVAEVAPGRVLGWQTRSWSFDEHRRPVKAKGYAVAYQGIHNITGPEGIKIDVNELWHDNWGQKPVGVSPPTTGGSDNNMVSIQPKHGRRGDPVWLPEVLKAFGVKVKEMPGWKSWGHGDFGAIEGVIVHHTAGAGTPASYIARNPGVGGGLSSQIHLARDGVATLCGAGIAYHAGDGVMWNGKAGNAQTADGKWGAVGNVLMIGIEAVNMGDGSQVWPEVQMDAYHRIVAAIVWYLGLPIKSVQGHKEYARPVGRKIDPNFNMDTFRANVKKYVDNPPFSGGSDSTGGLFMSLPIERQKDLASKIDRIHHELTHRFQTRYVNPDTGKQAGFRDTSIGYILENNNKLEVFLEQGLPQLMELLDWQADRIDAMQKALAEHAEEGK